MNEYREVTTFDGDVILVDIADEDLAKLGFRNGDLIKNRNGDTAYIIGTTPMYEMDGFWELWVFMRNVDGACSIPQWEIGNWSLADNLSEAKDNSSGSTVEICTQIGSEELVDASDEAGAKVVGLISLPTERQDWEL